MISTTELRPPGGSKPIFKLSIVEYGSNQPDLPLTSYTFSKDYNEARGTGSLSFPFSIDVYNKLKAYDKIVIKEGWVHPDGGVTLKEVMTGVIEKEPTLTADNIECPICDEGFLLEQTINVSYTKKKRSYIIKDLIKKAGLNPVVDFTGVTDDVLDYTSESDSGSGGVVSGIGTPSCAKCPEETKGKWWKTSVTDSCPSCGKTGTIVYVRGVRNNNCGNDDNNLVEGHYFCCKKIGGCDADYCVVCGTNHGWAKGGKFATPLSMTGNRVEVGKPSGTVAGDTAKGTTTPTGGSDGGTTSTNTTDESTTDAQSQEAGGKVIWDMLKELSDPVGHDLQIFVWLHNVYVRRVPPESEANLFVIGSKNLGENITINPGDPNLPNTVVVNYGNKKSPQSVKITHERFLRKYGEFYDKSAQVYNKYNLNRAEATAFGRRELDRIVRDGGFSIDCTVIGHPEWYIGRWAKFESSRFGFADTYYITRVAKKFGADELYTTDLTLAEYLPSVDQENDIESGGMSNLAGIMKSATRFKYCGDCQDSVCMEKVGCGSCWAMSEYLYNRMTASGIRARIVQYKTTLSDRHRSVQVWQNGGWVDVPYSQYSIDRKFWATSSKPGMFVYRGG